MALLGPQGLQRVASACHARLRQLLQRLQAELGIGPRFSAPCFHESVLALHASVPGVLQRMREAGVLGGLDLSGYAPDLAGCMLVCATETKLDSDIDRYVAALRAASA
jgi:glycine dehydrogenase subunit 1